MTLRFFMVLAVQMMVVVRCYHRATGAVRAAFRGPTCSDLVLLRVNIRNSIRFYYLDPIINNLVI